MPCSRTVVLTALAALSLMYCSGEDDRPAAAGPAEDVDGAAVEPRDDEVAGDTLEADGEEGDDTAEPIDADQEGQDRGDPSDDAHTDSPEEISPECPGDQPHFADGRPLEIPIDGQPIIRGTWDGRSDLAYLIDTGAQIVSYDTDLTDGSAAFFSVERTELGTTVLCDIPSKGRDLSEAEAWVGVNIDALLGQSALKSLYTFIDYAGLEAWLYKVEPPVAPPPVVDATFFDLRFELQNELPVAQIGITGDITVALLTDTGSGVTIIEEEAYDAMTEAYDGELPRLDGYVWATSYGTDDAFITRVPEMRLGDAVVEGEWVVVIPSENHIRALLEGSGVFIDGFLGYPAFRHFLVEVRGPSSMFRLWPYDSPPVAEDEWHRVGLELTARPEGHRVEMIFRPSGITDTAIALGDWLTHIDGEPVEGLWLDDVRRLLRGAPGDPRTLRIRSATSGESVDYAVEVEDLLPGI